MAYAEDIMDDGAEDERPAMPPEAFIAYVTGSDNFAVEMDEARLSEIGQEVVANFDTDKESMQEWLDRSAKAIDLAQLVKEDKDYPFKGASNIKYPLITSAALQFNARAYPAIVPSSDVVKAKVWGPDKQGLKAARGERVASYMTWQLLCEVEEWEKQMDTLLVQLPIVNDMFRKVWHDGERVRTKLIEPGKCILNAKAATLTDAPRVSEELDLFPHEIAERILDGRFVEFEYEDADDNEDPQCFIEMHCRLDLDDDEYPEPYIVTVHKETSTVVRLVADFDPEDVRYLTEAKVDFQPVPVIDQMTGQTGMVMQQVQTEDKVGIKKIARNHYFVHYQFMPAMDGRLLGLGLGTLMSDIASAVNSSINMLVDAGHYASLGGGFIGAEFRIRGGNARLRPGEYKMVQGSGDDVRKAIVDKTFPGPDATMFQMLGLLIDAGKEISSTKDIITSDNASQMTATTAMALIEQGMKVFTASYKRIYRSLKREFRLIADINARTLDPQKYAAFLEEPADPSKDFSAGDMDISPVADPTAVTKMQEMAKAQLLLELAGKGLVNPVAAGQRIMEAASIANVEELMPQQDPEVQQMQKMAMQLDLALKQATLGKAQADTGKAADEAKKLQAELVEILSGVQNDGARLRLDTIVAFLDQQRANVQQAIDMAALTQRGQPQG